MELNFLERKTLNDMESFDYLMMRDDFKNGDDGILRRLPDIIRDRYLKDLEEEELIKIQSQKEEEDERLKKKGLVRVKNDATDRRDNMRDRLRKKLLSKYE